ncbi:MAG: hypothetical protein HYZ20_17115 [Burkholderiales bacterium]|nr:hypothetical protein [Burkholderiales bacterium]
MPTHLIAVAWLYVVLMMALAEALSPQGTILGALITLLLYGLFPLGIVLYILGAPQRRRARRATEAAELEQHARAAEAAEPSAPPHGSGHAAGDAIAAERKEA